MRCPIRRVKSRLRRGADALSNDRGSVTVEAAIALSALVIVAAAIVGAIATMAAYVAAVDAAGAAARAHAIGEDFTPARGDMDVDVHESAGLVTAVVAVPAPVGSMSAQAVFPAEAGVVR